MHASLKASSDGADGHTMKQWNCGRLARAIIVAVGCAVTLAPAASAATKLTKKGAQRAVKSELRAEYAGLELVRAKCAVLSSTYAKCRYSFWAQNEPWKGVAKVRRYPGGLDVTLFEPSALYP
jgi:hypothetical protein